MSPPNADSSFYGDILVVDDTVSSLKLLSDILSDAGYRVRSASDGTLALRSVEARLPALILLDIKMPGMDGYEVCRRLKADEKTRSIPVMFISILGDERERIKGFRAGAVDYISKPFHPEEVLARVDTHFTLRRTQLDLERSNVELRAARDTLEERVRERSAALEKANRKLHERMDEHVRTLNALRESEDKYRSLVESTIDWVWAMDVEGRFTFSNRAVRAALGYTVDEVVGRPSLQLMHPEDMESWSSKLKKCTGENTGWQDESIRRFHKDGAVRTFESSARPILDANRNVVGFSGVDRDITDRRKAEKTSRDMVQFLQTLMDTIPVSIFYKDTRGIYRGCNKAYQSFLGLSGDDIVGKSEHELFPKDLADKYREMDSALLRDPGQQVYEWPLSCADGSRHDVIFNKATYFNSDGILAGLVAVVVDVTGLKQTEDRLRDSERQLHGVIEGSPIPTFVIDKEHKVLHWNRALEELSGLRAEDMVGGDRHWRAFYRVARPCMADLLVDGKMEELPEWYAGNVSESRMLRDAYEVTDFFPDLGENGKWLHFTAAVVTNYQGEIVGAIETLEDITERKLAEARLNESQKLLTNIIDFLPDPTFVIDLEGKVIAWSRAMEEMTRVGAADIIGKGSYEYALGLYGERRPLLIDLVLNPDAGNEAKYANIERKENVLAGESYIPMLGGGRVYLHGTASVLHDSKGNVIGAIESIRDITARKEAEEALLRAEEKYRTIFENAVEGIFQTTVDGRVIGANPALARILGYDSPEDILSSVTDVSRQVYVNPEARSEVLRLIDERGMVEKYEVRFFRKDRSIAWITMNLHAVRDAGGKVLHYEGTLQDISDRRLLETRLLQSQKMEAVGKLAGGIAHDFNNILAAVIGYTEIAKGKLVQQGLHHYLDQVLKACERARNLVFQILTFSRKADREIKPVDIGSIVRESLKLLRATIPSTIEIRQEESAPVGEVLADPTRLHQVMMNLCTNAAQAMREKGGVLEVALCSMEIGPEMLPFYPDLSPGRYVKLTVSDNGTGIPPDIVDKIFDPFFTTKKPGEGTGLGLSVVYGIVKDCGGTVAVRSELSKGSTFCVYLPEIDHGAEPAPDPAMAIQGGSERVLFVDDESVLVELGEEMLEGLGYEPVAVSSSARALEIFRARPDRFDLVVTDMTMPGMTGKDLAGKLLEIRPDIPIILCTGFSEIISEEEAKTLGIREFLIKPLSLREFARVVRSALDRRRE